LSSDTSYLHVASLKAPDW